jgi:hypothetical protein
MHCAHTQYAPYTTICSPHLQLCLILAGETPVRINGSWDTRDQGIRAIVSGMQRCAMRPRPRGQDLSAAISMAAEIATECIGPAVCVVVHDAREWNGVWILLAHFG